MSSVDLLAIAAHRDDVTTCAVERSSKRSKQGYRTAIIDLTQGRDGTQVRGNPGHGGQVALAEVLGVSARENLRCAGCAGRQRPRDA